MCVSLSLTYTYSHSLSPPHLSLYPPPPHTHTAGASVVDVKAAWRDSHLIEYYSLGNVTRTEHLVDDSTSNTYVITVHTVIPSYYHCMVTLTPSPTLYTY